jgi:tRNA pseudouridine13 synthase
VSCDRVDRAVRRVTHDYARALQLPCAHGGPIGRGVLRTAPEDFIVREWLGFEADNDGDHWLLTVRKREANTHWVAKQLAKLADIHPRDVGFAGLKDRNAVAEQAFTVPARSAVGSNWQGVQGDGFEVIAARRHRRKLKRGALKGNDFEIIVRGFTGSSQEIGERLAVIAARGVPNYFGPQRFGHELSNLKRAVAMFAGVQIHDRFERGFALSAARASVFNAVLARRLESSTWDRLIDGDVANLDGSNSIFSIAAIDALLIDRCTALDIHPTGPLWGRGELRSTATAAALEHEIGNEYQVMCAGLERAGLDQERRALRISVQALQHGLDGDVLTLRFRLGRGAFATTVLHELIEGAFEVETPETED